MDESTAWISQAVADQAAAERERAVAGRSKVPVWCHAVAKYQQAVEKSIKAIVVALRECGVRGVHPVGYDHRVQNHLRLLRRLPGGGAGRSIQRKLRDFLDAPTRMDIHRLESLAPRAPTPGDPHPRNTEYPFNDAHGGWTYPAAPDQFSVVEGNAFQGVAVAFVPAPCLGQRGRPACRGRWGGHPSSPARSLCFHDVARRYPHGQENAMAVADQVRLGAEAAAQTTQPMVLRLRHLPRPCAAQARRGVLIFFSPRRPRREHG